jgi:hypothetical protein
MVKYIRYALVWAAILAVLGALTWRFTGYREEQCAKNCIAQGKSRYQYKGFSGAGTRFGLRADVCTCLP